MKLIDWDIVVTQGFEEKFSRTAILVHIVTPCNRPITFFICRDRNT